MESPAGAETDAKEARGKKDEDAALIGKETLLLSTFRRWDVAGHGYIRGEKLRKVFDMVGIPEASSLLHLSDSDVNNDSCFAEDGFVDYTKFIQWLYCTESLRVNPTLSKQAELHAPFCVGATTTPTLDSELVVMTLNLQYFASFPKDQEAATRRLREATGGPSPPDVICVQEGISSRDVLGPVGFDLCVCAGRKGIAQSVQEMVYGDPATLRMCDENLHSELLCNQIYMRRDSSWEVVDHDAMRISSDIILDGRGGRAQGNLAIRSMVWAKLRRRGFFGPVVYVMCTHITGGRFEDQFFVQELSQERFQQPDRIIEFFNHRPDRSPDDIGVLLGDFNATTTYTQDGPMSGYFKASIADSDGVKADAQAVGVKVEDSVLEDHFKSYMTSPFQAIQQKHGWTLAYTQDQVGVTSGFGHLIDHMAVNRPIKVKSAEVIFLTNQKFSKGKKDTELPLTDHNSVKTSFEIPSPRCTGESRRPSRERAEEQ